MGLDTINDVLREYDRCSGDIRLMDGYRPEVGLCGGILSNVSIYTLWGIFYTWPKFSGSKMFPVPVGDQYIGDTSGAQSAYDEHASIGDLYTGEYGELRIELFHYIVAELRRMVDEQSS